jgi:hypothetical protein
MFVPFFFMPRKDIIGAWTDGQSAVLVARQVVPAKLAHFFCFVFRITAIESTRLSNRSYKISLTTCAHAQRGEFGQPKEGESGREKPDEGRAQKQARRGGMKQGNRPKQRSGNTK